MQFNLYLVLSSYVASRPQDKWGCQLPNNECNCCSKVFSAVSILTLFQSTNMLMLIVIMLHPRLSICWLIVALIFDAFSHSVSLCIVRIRLVPRWQMRRHCRNFTRGGSRRRAPIGKGANVSKTMALSPMSGRHCNWPVLVDTMILRREGWRWCLELQMALTLGNACPRPVDCYMGSVEGLCQLVQALPQEFARYRWWCAVPSWFG